MRRKRRDPLSGRRARFRARPGISSAHTCVRLGDPLLRNTRRADAERDRIGAIPRSCLRVVGALLLISAGGVCAVRSAAAVAPARYVRFSEVRTVLTELAGSLPADLNALSLVQL